MAPSVKIDRCVCSRKSFKELRTIADAHGAGTVGALQDHADFGVNCRVCHPYVRRMLRTGEVVFFDIIPEEDENG